MQPESKAKIRPEWLISKTPELYQIATDSSTGAQHRRQHQKLIMLQRSMPHLHALATANIICTQGALNIIVAKPQLVIFWLLFPRIENKVKTAKQIWESAPDIPNMCLN